MSSYILLVFEGEKTEKLIFDNMKKYYLNEAENIVISAYGSNIYQLYQKLKDDEYLDLFSLLQEQPRNQDTLASISSDEVSQIYLFFDYDGHASTASDDALAAMLTLFNNETETGMLYISYPMVESLKHIKQAVDFKAVVAESHKRYKYCVSQNSDQCYIDFRKYNQDNWNTLLSQHCKKLNYIINECFTLPNQYISQEEVFQQQKEKYIDPKNHVAVLSAFPIFIFDYYGKRVFPFCSLNY